jgi:DNA-binding transcriptional ArsR family regulator
MVRHNLPFVVANQDPSGESMAALFDALGDRSRRSIVECLRENPHAVTDLAARLPISRPAISQHLKVLGEAGLVTHEARGTRNVYSLDPVALEMMRDHLDVVWRDGLEAFRKLAEEQQ